MKFFSIFFTIFWLIMAVLAIMGYLTPWCAMCACLLAALSNLEEVFK